MNQWIFLAATLAFSPAVLAQHHGAAHQHDHQSGAHHSTATAQFDKASLNAQVHVEKCWVRLLPGTVPSAAYFTVHNQGQQDTAVIAARSSAHADVMVHETTHKDGMSHMGHTASVAIPAGTAVGFEPGGLHVMLEQATQPLQQGGTIQLELLYADHTKTVTTCELRSPKTQSY